MLFQICAGLTAVVATAAPVSAATQPRPAAGTRLVLAYAAEAGFATAVKLTCDPDGGGHPQPAQACAALTRVRANPARLKPADRYCFLLYKPITARLTGTWRGRSVTWAHTYGNSCEMNRATGVLFDF
ncbi:SSI family serine proteinase inhibitor [Actinoplanes oblitus]|uniref:SSI family serine proteinase inhibitor n=1 Tax=Actinoplanes oblitus TaxID=3040509 RepID=A0ABY8WMM8_9ACTN|nr:SSI family serine proteinase inhibitor [Actinoplanes oblitus]WIM98120.1 SSI family serine proteinase inhibitor [Actinoplanes oblitus]